jgi:NADH:ubiquinone oxidoreductase subunit 4 (subunit M)
MNFIDAHLLSLILFVPALAALILLFLPEGENKLFGSFALGASLIPFVLSLLAWFHFMRTSPAFSSKSPMSGIRRLAPPCTWAWTVSRSPWCY